MNTHHQQFCHSDPLFYDAASAAGDHTAFEIGRRALPAGWRRAESEDWVMHSPEPDNLPPQGWKIHVSGCVDNAERILDVVWDYCVGRRLAFKFLNSKRTLLARNAKEAPRGHSGKLVTIYPRDETELELACKELDEHLRGEPGPYILSDLRWRDGPVYVRYGGFLPLQVRMASGRVVPAIHDDTGRLVPDERPAVFKVPSWVQLPKCLEPHLEARNAVWGLPYRIVEALQISNGGGIYVGEHNETGERVILKEARPHAGLTGDGADAVTRLRHGHATMQRLAGIAAVPRVIDLLSVGDHLFLVMELVDGTPLNCELMRRRPALDSGKAEAACAAFAHWAMTVCHRVEDAIEAMHCRGIVFADLHLRNILIRSDSRIALVDYEGAFDAEREGQQMLAAPPGFRAPGDHTGTAVDDYGLACLRLSLFTPLTELCELAPHKAWELADVIRERFPVPRSWLDEAAQTITGTGTRQEPPLSWAAVRVRGWVAIRDALGRAIVASATPWRHDRLFPGDPAQFTTGGVNIAHGAAGVLYVLSVTGTGRHPDLEQWLVEHATQPAKAKDRRLGFYDGLHGVAYVLDHLGRRQLALELIERCLAAPWEDAGNDLRDGLAGMALNLAHLAEATGETTLHGAAVRAAEMVASRLGSIGSVADVSGSEHPYAGLMQGSTGPALLFVRLYETTGDTAWLDHAALALRQDLRRCVTRDDDGAMHVNEGSRTLPYLATGSVGIGLVLDRYLTHRPDEQFASASAAIHTAARSWFSAQSGLFSGRAGMVYYLAQRARAGHPTAHADLADQIRHLSWHAIAFGDGGLAFAGDQLIRLSMDLATGTAGVLLALGAALPDSPVHLPFLEPRDQPTPSARGGEKHATPGPSGPAYRAG